MINTSNVTFMTQEILTTLSGLSILRDERDNFILPVVDGMYLIKHTNQFYKLENDLELGLVKQHWYVIGCDTGGKKAIKYVIPGDSQYTTNKTIQTRRWLRGLSTTIPATTIESMNEVFVKYFAVESIMEDIPPRYQQRVMSDFMPRLKEIVAFHG